MSNLQWCEELLKTLNRFGVEDVVVCAGARNGPLLELAVRAQNFRTYSFFEERSAAFFALGLARRSLRPTAILTTSGTAALEILPAVAEAYFSGIPLVALTADRPKRLRLTGAPQTIDQRVFSKFVSGEWDLQIGDDLTGLSRWQRLTPIHINACIDEPLIDAQLPSELKWHHPIWAPNSCDTEMESESFPEFEEFWKKSRYPLILVGGLRSVDRENVLRLLEQLPGSAIYCEANSQLRNLVDTKNFTVLTSEQILSWAYHQNHFDAILRLGSVPTARIWRDLENNPVVALLSLSHLPFPGTSRGRFCHTKNYRLNKMPLGFKSVHADLKTFETAAIKYLRELLQKYPQSEVGLLARLSALIPTEARVFLGNSLPIREWDLVAHRRFACISANRGVNGIDGQISTFYGEAQEQGSNWAILGDLTSLYDLSAPWALSQRPKLAESNLVIVNNQGGQIFSRVTCSASYINSHRLEFSHWARMWGLDYEKWLNIPESLQSRGHRVIELVPDATQSNQFWNEWDDNFRRGGPS